MKIIKNNKGQAIAPKTIKIRKEDLKRKEQTSVYWLGHGGALLNVEGTIIMIDPLIKNFDMPVLIENPIEVEEVEQLDAVLITHIDNDHYSVDTCEALKEVCDTFHATQYVATVMKENGLNSVGHDIDETFKIKDVEVTLTPALHNWQNGSKKYQHRYFEETEYCGYYVETKKGSIWMVGDSKLLECQLNRKEPDIILFDFSDNEWHITLEGAKKLANAYPNSRLICIHWGCVDAPDMSPFNGNPEDLLEGVVNPERILVVAPGQEVVL